MFKRLADNTRCARNWTGNDRVGRNHFGRVRLKESPLTIALYWKRSDYVGRKLVGKYELDLNALLAGGFICSANGYPGEVILRFQRTAAGQVEIATGRHARTLVVGKWP